MIEIFIVYSDEKQIEKVKGLKKDSLTFNFIDITTKKGKRIGWDLKNHWAAKLDPFILILKEDKPFKVFYSEAENVINKLINYINEELK